MQQIDLTVRQRQDRLLGGNPRAGRRERDLDAPVGLPEVMLRLLALPLGDRAPPLVLVDEGDERPLVLGLLRRVEGRAQPLVRGVPVADRPLGERRSRQYGLRRMISQD